MKKLFVFAVLALICISGQAQYTFNLGLDVGLVYYTDIDTTSYTDSRKWYKKWDKAYFKKFDEATLNNLAYSEYHYYSKKYRNDNDKSMMAIVYSHFETAGDRWGDKLALCNLGLFHFYGIHDEVDYEKAVGFFMRSADRGCKLALYCLGYCYQYGKGVQVNLEKAKKLYEEAAAKLINDKRPRRALGALYANRGVYNGAIYWFEKVVDIRDNKTDYADYRRLGLCYLMAKEYDKALIALARAAEGGDCYSQFTLGKMYLDGQGVGKDYNKAVSLFEKAAKNGDFWEPYYYLGVCYLHGYGVTKNLSKALDMHKKAALDGSPVTQYAYGVLCLYDEYKLYEESERYILLSANQGDLDAISVLGKEYYEGTHYQRNFEKAVEYLNKAINLPKGLDGRTLTDRFRGYALHTLAACYRYGRGVKLDEERAKELEEEASKYGNNDAKDVLTWIQSLEDERLKFIEITN